MTTSGVKTTASPATLIDERIASLDDWRGTMLEALPGCDDVAQRMVAAWDGALTLVPLR